MQQKRTKQRCLFLDSRGDVDDRNLPDNKHNKFKFIDLLKTLDSLDTIGNCKRPVFSHGVSQHMYKKTNLWKFELNWSSKLRDNNKRKNTLFRYLISRPQNLILSSWYQIGGKLLLCENYVTSEGAVSHYQQLPINRYQVRFYAKNYFE